MTHLHQRSALKISSAALLLALACLAVPSAAEPIRFGMTFPHRDLRAHGYDWREALEAADELGLRLLRIGAYWSDLEPAEGEFDFSELEELIGRAQDKGYQLIVTVGMKAPVWPEYYIPDWAAPSGKHSGGNREVTRDPELRGRALRFVEETVCRLSGYPSIVAWQVENEPMDRAGERRWFIGADFVELEAKAVRRSDPEGRPVIVNVWADNQLLSARPWSDPKYAVRNAVRIGDVLGIDVYPKVTLDIVSPLRTYLYPRWFRNLAHNAGKPAWVIESQAEPWAFAQVGPDDIRWLVGVHRSQGFDTVVLWGFQTWYEGKRNGNPALWDAVRELVKAEAGAGSLQASTAEASRPFWD